VTLETPDRALRYFLCIAELGSISKAADTLDQTQSGLSKQLAMLEANVGKPLFIRTGRGVELTEAGRKLYDAARPAYQTIDHALDGVRQQGVTHGTVRLATVHTLSYYFTADVVANFLDTRPHVNLSLMGRSSPEVVTLVDSGKADLGFVYDVAVDTGTLASSPLFEEEMVVIVHRDSDLASPQDLIRMELRLIGFPPHYALRRMIHSAGLRPTYVAEAETVDAMLRIVSSGLGCCILPSRIPDKLLSDNGLRKLSIVNPVLRRRVVAITRAGKPFLPLVAELLHCAVQVASARRGQCPE